MNDTKKSPKTETPAHSFVRGHIRADIWIHQSHTGYEFAAYTLSRIFSTKSGNTQSSSSSFFENSRDDLIAAINDATNWISKRGTIATSDLNSTSAHTERE
jgi:hypothetical protein